MKTFILVILSGLLWTSVLFAAGNQYALRVDGLACPFCAYGIEKRLSDIEGVEDIAIDIGEGKAIITLKEGKTLSEEEARQAVREAGFTLREFSRVQGDQ